METGLQTLNLEETKNTSIFTQKDNFPRYYDLIGDTPLIDLTSLANPKVPGVRVLGKAEFLNPGFSHKDRIVRSIFAKAEAAGKLKPGMTIVAASSGNTGASVAMISAMRGYECTIITNSKCSKEKCDSIKAYGARLMIAKEGQCYMQMETDLAQKNPDWFSVNQYDNLDNPEGHYTSTGPEIWAQTGGKVTHFVMGGSTGGTISGVGKYLKEQNPAAKIILADPIGSIFTNYFKTGELGKGKSFLVEGVGKANIPGCLDFDVVDDVVQVSDVSSFSMCKKLAQKEGIMVGGSAGMNVHAAIEVANNLDESGTVVTLLCDLGIKYLSKVFNDEWCKEKGVYSQA